MKPITWKLFWRPPWHRPGLSRQRGSHLAAAVPGSTAQQTSFAWHCAHPVHRPFPACRSLPSLRPSSTVDAAPMCRAWLADRCLGGRKLSDNNPATQPGCSAPDGEIVPPSDSPRDSFFAALSGSQAEFSARLIDGRYVVGLAQEERKERYRACMDLADQLTGYVNRELAQKPALTMPARLDNISGQIAHPGWELGSVALDWIMKQLQARFP